MRRVGFRALKKTLEAPYTTKVNNRVRTSRGTTRSRDRSGHRCVCILYTGVRTYRPILLKTRIKYMICYII